MYQKEESGGQSNGKEEKWFNKTLNKGCAGFGNTKYACDMHGRKTWSNTWRPRRIKILIVEIDFLKEVNKTEERAEKKK